MDNQSLSHTKWKCQYHVVFIPKYNKLKKKAKRCCCWAHIRRYLLQAIPKGHERDYEVMKSLFYWLNRRSQKKSYNWVDFLKMISVDHPLAKARSYVNIYAR